MQGRVVNSILEPFHRLYKTPEVPSALREEKVGRKEAEQQRCPGETLGSKVATEKKYNSSPEEISLLTRQRSPDTIPFCEHFWARKFEVQVAYNGGQALVSLQS